MPEETPQLPVSPQETQIQAPSFWEKVQTQKKKILIGLGSLLGVLILTGAVFGVYKYAQNQILLEPTPTPLPAEVSMEEGDPTADWETYVNNELSFKYPAHWIIETDRIIGTDPNVVIYVVSKDSTLMNECMQMDITEKKNGLVIKKFSRVTTGEMCSTDDPSPREIWVVPTEDDYSPGISYSYTIKDSPKAEDTFDLILSTFKFLEEGTPSPTPSAKIINYQVIDGWTRYDNVSGSYSIQYDPKKYKIVDEDTTNPTYSIIDELTLSCITPNCQTGIWIRIYSNYNGGSNQKWLEDARGISRTERYLEDVIVENAKALIAMDDRITEVAIPLSGRMVSIEMKGPFYNVTQKMPVNIEFVYQFLSTFRFLE